MNKQETVVRVVAAELKIKITKVENHSERYFATDGFTTIFASSKHTPIADWALTHKKFVDTKWPVIKAGLFKPKNVYEKITSDLLKQCLVKPEVDIILENTYGDVEVVVYTDTTDAKIEEAESFKKTTKGK